MDRYTFNWTDTGWYDIKRRGKYGLQQRRIIGPFSFSLYYRVDNYWECKLRVGQKILFEKRHLGVKKLKEHANDIIVKMKYPL